MGYILVRYFVDKGAVYVLMGTRTPYPRDNFIARLYDKIPKDITRRNTVFFLLLLMFGSKKSPPGGRGKLFTWTKFVPPSQGLS